MKTLIIITYGLILLIIQSCEPCEKNIGKEQINISHLSDIDSIEIDESFTFSKIKREPNLGFLYSTEWSHFANRELEVTVFRDSIDTILKFEIQDNMRLSIYLYDTIQNFCSEVDLSRQEWQFVTLDNVQACFYFEEYECP